MSDEGVKVEQSNRCPWDKGGGDSLPPPYQSAQNSLYIGTANDFD